MAAVPAGGGSAQGRRGLVRALSAFLGRELRSLGRISARIADQRKEKWPQEINPSWNRLVQGENDAIESLSNFQWTMRSGFQVLREMSGRQNRRDDDSRAIANGATRSSMRACKWATGN